jgi:hypothetical protein
VGYNASGVDNVITTTVECEKLDQISAKLKAAGIEHTNYKVLEVDLVSATQEPSVPA